MKYMFKGFSIAMLVYGSVHGAFFLQTDWVCGVVVWVGAVESSFGMEG